MVLFQFSFLEKNSPGKNSLFSLSNFLKVKPKVSTSNVAATILLYSISYDLTTIIYHQTQHYRYLNKCIKGPLCVVRFFVHQSLTLQQSRSLIVNSKGDFEVLNHSLEGDWRTAVYHVLHVLFSCHTHWQRQYIWLIRIMI